MRIVVAAILGLFIIPARAGDELEFCALVISAPAGYIILHDGPGTTFGTRAKLVVDDLLYADTSRCSIWEDGACTDSHTHVYSVHRMDGAPRDNMHGFTAGWVRTKYIKAVSCDLDWGYRDPAWPTLEALDTDPPPSGLNVLTRK